MNQKPSQKVFIPCRQISGSLRVRVLNYDNFGVGVVLGHEEVTNYVKDKIINPRYFLDPETVFVTIDKDK